VYLLRVSYQLEICVFVSQTHIKQRENDGNVILGSEHRLQSSPHGLTMNLVDWRRTSADEPVVWSPRCRDLCDGLLAGVGCSSLTLRFS